MQQRNLVEHVGEPLRLLLPVQAEAPQRVVQRFLAHGHLRRQRLLVDVLQGAAERQVLREVVLPVDAEHRLALHAVVAVRLQRDVDVRAGIDDALVQDGHLAGRVVNTVVGALLQGDTAGGDDDGALRHVVGAQRDDVGARTLILSHELELVLLGGLLGNGLRRVVELVEHVLVGHAAQSGSL